MKIAVFGMGYVGVVSAACLARDGHDVIGVDPNTVKTDLINQGKSPIVEPGLEELLSAGVRAGRIRTVTESAPAVEHAEVIFICVGTPGNANGSLDLSFVRRVCEQIGANLARPECAYKTVTVRSTLLPGSTHSVVVPALESRSAKKAGRDFGVCVNPEFLREGSAIRDYDHPPKTIIGASDDNAVEPLRRLYASLDAQLFVTDVRTAEMVKYADNSWHALKVSFANEMGRLCKAMQVDGRELMRLFCEDRKLNISPAYLRPGFAFGGSCLPKDVRAVTYQARSLDIQTPVLSAILPSNRVQIDEAFTMIQSTGQRRVGLLGLGFKEGTDDLRESAIVTLAERLIGKGYDIRIYDRNVQLASLLGANKDYILNHIPHIGKLLVSDPAELFGMVDVVVVASGEEEFADFVRTHGVGKHVIDLVGKWNFAAGGGEPVASYDGVAW